MRLLDELGPPPVDVDAEFRRAWARMIEDCIAAGRIYHGTPRQPFNQGLLVVLHAAPPWGFYGSELRERSAIQQSNLSKILRRWRDTYRLIESKTEVGDPHELGRGLRTYHRLTQPGRDLAALAVKIRI